MNNKSLLDMSGTTIALTKHVFTKARTEPAPIVEMPHLNNIEEFSSRAKLKLPILPH